MKIELKNIKHHTSLSEETQAFTGMLYIDGKRVAHASNRGHGEPVNLQPLEGKRALLDRVETRLAMMDKIDTGEGFSTTPDLDYIVAKLVSTDLVRKLLKREAKQLAGPNANKTSILIRRTGKILESAIGPYEIRKDGNKTGPVHELLVAQYTSGGYDPVCLNTLYERDPDAVARELAENEGLIEDYNWMPERLLSDTAA